MSLFITALFPSLVIIQSSYRYKASSNIVQLQRVRLRTDAFRGRANIADAQTSYSAMLVTKHFLGWCLSSKSHLLFCIEYTKFNIYYTPNSYSVLKCYNAFMYLPQKAMNHRPTSYNKTCYLELTSFANPSSYFSFVIQAVARAAKTLPFLSGLYKQRKNVQGTESVHKVLLRVEHVDVQLLCGFGCSDLFSKLLPTAERAELPVVCPQAHCPHTETRYGLL